jgi:Domain of unknown function (DUF4390)
MPATPDRCHELPGRVAGRPWFAWPALLKRVGALLVLFCATAFAPAWAQGVELALLQTARAEGGLNLDFSARVSLPKTAEDALLRGVPIYFVAEASLLRGRWYWRDERVARVSRSWRVAFQPLTGAWRVSLAGLNQSYATLSEALTAASRSASWRLAELNQLDPDKSYYLQFSYRLDTSQLPGPMQFGLGGGGEWAVGVNREIRVEP